MTRNWPIRARLAVAYGAVFLLGMAVLELSAYLAVTRGLDTLLDRELRDRRQVLEEYVANHVGRRSWPELAPAIAEHRGFQPDWLGVQDEAGRDLYMGARIADVLRRPRPSGIAVRLSREIRMVGGRRYVFLTATDATIAADLLDRLQWLMAVSAPLLLLLSSGAGYWMAGRALRPIADLTTATREIDAHRLSTRLTVPATRDELQALAETINHMLARIEAAFEQAKRFTADASHELRTPMAVIRATAEVALMRASRQPGDTPERAALEQILQQAERNTQLLDDLLRLARLDAGAEPIQLKTVDIAGSLLEAAAGLVTVAERRGIRLETAVPDGDWKVQADMAHLRRLWTILLDNALKFTAAGGEIRIELTPGADGEICCAIRDTGSGIPAEDLPHVFERFYRADKARRTGGYGLGLALASQIVEAHGATITAESRLGEGSCFRVAFGAAPATEFSGKSQVIQTSL